MKKIKDIDILKDYVPVENANNDKYECIACKGKGFVECAEDEHYMSTFDYVKGVKVYLKECTCRVKNRFERSLNSTGLDPVLEKIMNVEYQTKFDWQKDAYSRAKRFVSNDDKGLIISGQTGSGKTLLLGKMAYNFAHSGKEVIYFDWHNDFKGQLIDRYNVVNEELINKLINVDVLYIDDFLKTSNNNISDLQSKTIEIMTARKIIDRRVSMRNKKTMISMELFQSDIEKLEPSLNGRLIELVEKIDNWIHMNPEEDRNIRMLKAQGKF